VSGVILRVAFGSDGSVTDEGFAFDNVQVYDYSRPRCRIIFYCIFRLNGCALSGTELVEVQIVNAGTANISNFPVSISVNNGTPLTENSYCYYSTSRHFTLYFHRNC